jgi:hypothetical protein
MSVRRAHDMAVQIGSTRDVGNVAPAPCQEAAILKAPH